MKRIPIYILNFLIILFFTGCGQQAATLHKQGSYQYKNLTIELDKKVKSLNITVDSGRLQIYCWDKPEVSCEVKYTVRDKKSDEQLEKLLNKFSTKTDIKDNICYIDVDYNGDIRNSNDILSDIRLTIPRRINSIELSQDQGNFVVEDKFEGSIKAELKAVNTEIKALEGSMSVKCEKGNVRLNSGKLSGGSDIKIKTGNIYIKAECANESDSTFENETGNIELSFPAAAGINLDALGTISYNQFAGSEGNIKVSAISKLGKISVDGY